MRPTKIATMFLLSAWLLSCTTYKAYEKGAEAEKLKNWDGAVQAYSKALEIDPDNIRYRIALERARLSASQAHFEKGNALRAARQYDLAALELEMTVKLDPTNQYAAVELAKTVNDLREAQRALDHNTVDEMKKRAKITKAQPPQLNPASEEPISLQFPRDTPVKDIYRALGNAFGINILFDAGVKDDRMAIELHDVTAQQALERVMQQANHFYKVLDPKTIIVVPDNPQSRRDYEDLVIQTFYLSNGDAEQVTNVVRTMIEARNVFPLKALNAITIRDTRDKVLIAEKIIEANDKAKAEVVVDVELLQLDVAKAREIGAELTSYKIGASLFKGGAPVPALGLSPRGFREIMPSSDLNFTIPGATYSFLKSNSNATLLAKPQLRISEGEKASLHIGSRVPVPSTSTIIAGGGTQVPITSFTYQDIGIKISLEPRVHHNREVTLKLTVEVSNIVSQGTRENEGPTIGTRTIESTIRLKDGETNFLAGLIRRDDSTAVTTFPFLGDIPILGRIFNKDKKNFQNTDVVLTMTPHIIRIPDITEDDLAPMWVGTQNNLTFRGVSPRIESAAGTGDPFVGTLRTEGVDTSDVDAAIADVPPPPNAAPLKPAVDLPSGLPHDPFRDVPPPPPTPPSTPGAQQKTKAASQYAINASPRIAPQPINLSIKPGEEKMWPVIGMDLDGLTTTEMRLSYDPQILNISAVSIGTGFITNVTTPPAVTVNPNTGTIKITSSDGKSLAFNSGGELLVLRVRGVMPGDGVLTFDKPVLVNAKGEPVQAAIAGGRSKVE
ncbi:MAG TPA: cohesin domain-containing protein [Thermoanaerobaculia bacterium]|nr:cohesin domain-containing protein [Thermoanaerobaculia bacterium]